MSHKLSKPDEISVLIRFHAAKSVEMLDTALFSLLGQGAVLVRAVVLCQELSSEKFADVEAVCDVYRGIGLETDCFNELFEDSSDHRAELLTRGIARCNTRFLAFLDCDDVIYPGMYEKLIGRLNRGRASIAFGGCVRADYYSLNGGVHFTSKHLLFQSLPKSQFFHENQYPIHSYVIDRHKVDDQDLYFDKGESRNKDYAFLYRILRKHESDDFFIASKLSEYRIDVGGSNTIMAFNACQDGAKAWAAADAYMVGIRKSSTIVTDYESIIDYSKWVARDRSPPRLETEHEISQARQYRLQVKSLVSSWDRDLGKLEFYIDSVDKGNPRQTTFSGWLHGNGARPFFAVCQDSDGEVIGEWDDFRPRKDVSAALGLDSDELGFSFRIPADHDRIRIKCITVKNEFFISPLIKVERGGVIFWNDLAELPPEEFVDYIFEKILGRQADAGGRAHHTKLVVDGVSRLDIVNAFLTNQEFNDSKRSVRVIGLPQLKRVANGSSSSRSSPRLFSFLKSRLSLRGR